MTSTQEQEVNNNQTVKEAESLTNITNLTTSRTITVTDPEEWICVAKLPPDTDQQAFQHLLSDFGAVKDSFLQKSTKTGELVFRPCQFLPPLSPPLNTMRTCSPVGPSTHVGNLDIADTIRAPGNRQICPVIETESFFTIFQLLQTVRSSMKFLHFDAMK